MGEARDEGAGTGGPGLEKRKSGIGDREQNGRFQDGNTGFWGARTGKATQPIDRQEISAIWRGRSVPFRDRRQGPGTALHAGIEHQRIPLSGT